MSEALSITPQMLVVMGLLVLVVVLFVTEMVRLDVAAISILVVLGLLSLVPGLDGITDTHLLFSGFASNAVISIIAVMILGAGLDKTGVMSRVAGLIMRAAGHAENRITPWVSGATGLMSGFIQNVGAAALFLPVVSRICARTGLTMSRLLMPMGFCAIMGGTLTLVGSSPLILLNDLLPAGMEPFGLFDVTPIGLALIASGMVYFSVFGRYVLPTIRTAGASGESTMQYFQQVYGLDFVIREVRLTPESKMTGLTVGDLEKEYGVVAVATFMKGEIRVGPWSGLTLEPRAQLALLGHVDTLRKLAANPDFQMFDRLDVFAESLSHVKSGIAEVVIPPASKIIGKTVTELAMRKTYGLSVLAIHRGEETIRQGRRDTPLQAGDTLVCHCSWNALFRLEKDRDFVVVTSEYPHEELRPQKVHLAVIFFLLAMGLVLFTDLRLSVALMAGAIGMILAGVLTMDEAYQAISWRTVFLLAGLIPLGMAVEETGTAAWIAQQVLALPGLAHPLLLHAAIAVLATGFTLVMSNVGATVLLVPLAVQFALVAQSMGLQADPRVYALTVAIMTSNAFLLPTHQVSALIMGPGGYRVKDFIRAGGGMTVLFLVIGLVMLNVLY
jgi:di/tricarboxylate transporter